MRNVRFLLPVCFSLALFCPSGLSATSLAGKTIDSSGNPIAGVAIHLVDTPFQTTSSDEGRFAITLLEPGNYRLRATCPGFQLLELDVSVADETQSLFELVLLPTLIHINEEIVVTTQRYERTAFDVPEAVSTLEQSQLARKALRSTPEALMGVTGVWMQKTNHGGGSPFLRGLTGNQTLIMVDGIRLNNATFRYGPNQYLATIAPHSIERSEVIRGSGSVLYGSDALGGVVQVLTKSPGFSGAGIKASGSVNARYMSSDMDRSLRGELELSAPKWAVYGGFDFRKFGDIVAGGDIGTQSPSGYDETSADIKSRFQLSSKHLLTLAYQHVHQDDVPRYDQVAQRGYQRYSFVPQQRQLFYARTQSFFSSPWLEQVVFTASFHRSIEGRVKQKQGQTLVKTERDEVDTWGATLEIHSTPRPNWRMTSGLELYHDRVGSWARNAETLTGEVDPLRGLYPDGSSASSLAVFNLQSIDLDRWRLTVGGRFNAFEVSAEDELFGDLRINPKALVGSFSALYELRPTHHLAASINTAFRAPNINDLSSFGSFDFGIEVPSLNLDPEKSLTIEVGHKSRTERFSTSFAIYATRLFDLITRVEATYEGEPIYEGERVYKKENVAEAHIYGVEADFEWSLPYSAAAFGSLVYTYGQNDSKDEPMRRIPPLYGRLGIRYQGQQGFWSELEWLYGTHQDRLASGDIADHRIPEGGTPGWNVVNLRLGYIFLWFRVNGGIQNLFDEAFRLHGSGVDGYGRSAWVSADIPF